MLTLEDLDHAAFRPPVRATALDARQDVISMHCVAEIARGNEEITFHARHRLVRHDEAVTITVRHNSARDQIPIAWVLGRGSRAKGSLVGRLPVLRSGRSRGPLSGQAIAAATDFFDFPLFL